MQNPAIPLAGRRAWKRHLLSLWASSPSCSSLIFPPSFLLLPLLYPPPFLLFFSSQPHPSSPLCANAKRWKCTN
eukprot:1746523-Pyramimonas_sp.AAC.1